MSGQIDERPATSVTPGASVAPAAPVAPAARTLKQRLAATFAEYGRIAFIAYLVLSLLTIAGFSLAIGVGAEPSSATGVLGVVVAGWLAAKATMPIRILIVLAVTPAIAAIIRWRRRHAPVTTPDD